MKRFRYFKAKNTKNIKDWKVDGKTFFRPHPYHVIKVDMEKRTCTVYSHFNMTPVIFNGGKPEMQMSLQVFSNYFKYDDWKTHWVDQTEYYENLDNE